MLITISNNTQEYSISNMINYVHVLAEYNCFRIRFSNTVSDEDLNLIRTKLNEFISSDVEINTNNDFKIKIINVTEITHKNTEKCLYIRGDNIEWI